MNESLIAQLEAYQPYNEQEERDRELILSMLRTEKNLFFRSNTNAHMTASAWVVNRDRTRTLMVFHNIYNSWSWLGGHADGNENLAEVALKEVREESGLSSVRAVSDSIYSLEVLTVDGHMKNGSYVSSHLHLNITYLLEADEDEELHVKEDENSGVKWFSFDKALEASTEPWFTEHIYSKLIEKLLGPGSLNRWTAPRMKTWMSEHKLKTLALVLIGIIMVIEILVVVVLMCRQRAGI